jgi:hypothetical protein
MNPREDVGRECFGVIVDEKSPSKLQSKSGVTGQYALTPAEWKQGCTLKKTPWRPQVGAATTWR